MNEDGAAMRREFLLDPDTVFLNHGSYGACPREVFSIHQGWQREMERNPVHFLGRRSAALLAAARAPLAQYLHADADELAFVPNATTGVNIVAQSVAAGWLQPGDEVLSTDHEYGACDETWRRVCASRGAQYRAVQVPLPFDSNSFAARMLDAATPSTRVIFVSHITSATALIFPLVEVCREARQRGIRTVVDGAHAPGQIDVDLAALGADAYTGNCHKWLCAPKGAAFLHLRREHHAQVRGPITSWGDVAGDAPQSPYDSYTGCTQLERRLLWQGTRDIAAWLAVPAALDFQQRHDWSAQRQRCHRMAVALMHRLCARHGTQPIAADGDFAQMVSIPLPHDDGAALREWLFTQHRIEVPLTWHQGHTLLRVSVQAYNTPADLQALASALDMAMSLTPADGS